jgi:uncharacterized protein (DUF2141 family)
MKLPFLTGVPILLCAFFTTSAHAQNPALPQDKCSIGGTVIDTVSGMPVKGAAVKLRGIRDDSAAAPQSTSASTHPSGRFLFEGLSTGRYILLASHDGYVKNDPAFGYFGEKWLMLATGQRVSDVVLRLVPDGTVAGHITNEVGKPVRGVSVQALKSSYPRGRRRLRDVAHAATNDAGEYRFPSLTPGKYYVRAKPPGSLKAKPGTEKSYVPLYYPAANDPGHTVALVLRAGEDLAGIDLNLVPVRTFHISGRVMNGQTLSPSGEAEVTLLSDQGETVFSPGEDFSAHGQASFEFQGVPPGSYVVVAQQPGTPKEPKTMWGQTSVEIKDSNQDHVEVVVSAGVDVSGHIRVEGDKTVDLTKEVRHHRMEAILDSQEPSALANLTPDIDRAKINSDGSFVFREVPQGNYAVNVFSITEGFYLKSSGATDVLETGITVSRSHSPAPLELVLTPGAGRIEGTLERDQRPVPRGLVVLVPDGKGRSQPNDYQTCLTSLSGGFGLSNIIPGDYTLFAWEQVERGAYFDPEFLAQYEDRGKAVHIEQGGHMTVKLDVIPATETVP